MRLNNFVFLTLILLTVLLTPSCDQNESVDITSAIEANEVVHTDVEKRPQHPYGGWYCPDNFGMFPPVDIDDLAQVPVVKDRLPTKEETRNGTSLMYFEHFENLDARPLEIDLPRIARKYSNHSGMNELVIIIQAVVIGQDTVVGFRFPNGGNGSAWYDEVTFLSDQEIKDIDATSFVYFKTEVTASKGNIWEAITSTEYAKQLAERFDKKQFFQSEWMHGATTHLNFNSDSISAKGIVMTLYGSLYMQIDYNIQGFHYSEKVMVIDNRQKKTTELHVVSGPYSDEIEAKNYEWSQWIQNVKMKSEKSK